MDGRRSALIIASSAYQDPGLSQLRAPAADADELAQVLRDPEIGDFDVRTMLNEPAHVLSESIEDFFADRRRDDLLLLHLSCHGIKGDDGELYFAAANTKLRRLGATAIRADFVNWQMNRSRSRRVVLLLDCCYSGAFERGMVPRAGADVDLQDRLSGRGRAVITASSAMEYALESETGELADIGQSGPSVFTSAVVKGLRTGEADIDQDGVISLEELYEYVYDTVRQTTRSQTPSKWTFAMEGGLEIARRRGAVTVPSQLPPELLQALEHPLPSVRVGGVQTLAGLLTGRHAGLALAARLALERLAAEDDSRTVAAAAKAALDTLPRLELSATSIDFGLVTVGAEPPRRTIGIRNAGGGELDPTVTSRDGWLRVELAGSELTVIPDTSSPGELRGQVAVQSSGGSSTIEVVANVRPPTRLSVEPRRLDFGRLVVGNHQVTRRIEVSDPAAGGTGWSYRTEADFLDVSRDHTGLSVRPRPIVGRHVGAILLEADGASWAVPVAATIEEDPAAAAEEAPAAAAPAPQPTRGVGLQMVKPTQAPGGPPKAVWLVE